MATKRVVTTKQPMKRPMTKSITANTLTSTQLARLSPVQRKAYAANQAYAKRADATRADAKRASGVKRPPPLGKKK
jgi:hypothetical protein